MVLAGREAATLGPPSKNLHLYWTFKGAYGCNSLHILEQSKLLGQDKRYKYTNRLQQNMFYIPYD